jgi:hypothetical protein
MLGNFYISRIIVTQLIGTLYSAVQKILTRAIIRKGMDWGGNCLLECGAVFISGLSLAVPEAGE